MGLGDLDGRCADNGSRKRDRRGSAEHQEDARILLDRARGICGRRICRDIESRCFGGAVLSAGLQSDEPRSLRNGDDRQPEGR